MASLYKVKLILYRADKDLISTGLSERPFPDTFTYTLVDPLRTRM